MKAKSNQEIQEFLEPYAKSLGLEIFEVCFKMSKNPSLTIYVDKEEGGIDLDTLEIFHNTINAPLDEFNPYDSNYTLNVSSPGLHRPFKTEKDFNKNIGKMVEVKLYAPIKSSKYLEGELVSYDKSNVVIKVKGENVSIAISSIAKINQAIIF